MVLSIIPRAIRLDTAVTIELHLPRFLLKMEEHRTQKEKQRHSGDGELANPGFGQLLYRSARAGYESVF